MATNNPISISSFKSSCHHFNTYLLEESNLRNIQQLDAFLWFLFSQNEIYFHSHSLSCQVQDEHAQHSNEIYFCLDCKQPCCMNFKSISPSHLMKHSHSEKHHKFYFQSQKRRFFCCDCRDFIMLLHSKMEEECLWKILFPKYYPIYYSAKVYKKVQNFSQKQELVPYEQMKLPIGTNSLFGIRGINNLGNTCFLGSVVQVCHYCDPEM